MASICYYAGGSWTDFPFDSKPRQPIIEVTRADDDFCKFTLSNTDVSVANALRRIILAEVPAMAIEIVNVEENSSVLFDEFIAHRMGLLPLSSHGVGDLPANKEGFIEHKDCNCYDGCSGCSVEYKLDVENLDDKVLNVTHFDVKPTGRWTTDITGERVKDMPLEQEVRPCPHPDASLDPVCDAKDNGILITKLRKHQRIAMTCLARKGIAKYHSKFMPVCLSHYKFQPTITLDREMVDSLTLEEKVAFVQSDPRKVFGLDDNDLVQIQRLDDYAFDDECVAKAREMGKQGMVSIKMANDIFHFTIEAVTSDGPRKPVDVVRAAMRILDYKLQLFLRDAYGDEIQDTLPLDPLA